MTDARSKILAHACELYLTDGLDGFSMRKLARRLGVTAPALYRHFSSREEVIVAIVGESHRILGQYLYRSLSGRSPEERFRMAGEAYLDFALDHPRLYEMLYLSPSVLGVDDYPPEVSAQACATGQFWMDRVRESMDAGMLRTERLEDVGVTIWAHAHGLISLYLRGGLDLPRPAFRELFFSSGRRLFRGLATPEWLELHDPPPEGAETGEAIAPPESPRGATIQ